DGCDFLPALYDLVADTVSADYIHLRWTYDSINETGFRIKRGLAEDAVLVQIDSVAANTSEYWDTFELTPNTEYCYRVVAYNCNGESHSENISPTCVATPFTPVLFSDIINQTVVQEIGPTRAIAWGDVNNDGYEDLFIANAANLKLYIYDPDADAFNDVSSQYNLVQTETASCAVWGDYNNDGFLDLFVGLNNEANQFYENTGTSFLEKAAETNLNDDGSAQCAAWADYDLDGFLDLFLGREDGQANLLYQNNDDSFTSVDAGLANITGNSRACAWADFNKDCYPDLYVANDGQPNNLFQNSGGAFSDVAGAWQVAGGQVNSVGCAWADFNNDGLVDLYVTNYGQNNNLYQNETDEFSDVAAAMGVSGGSSGSLSPPAWADVDNDGFIDLYVGNEAGPVDHLFLNKESVFVDEAVSSGIENTNGTTCAAWADYDGNGFPDLYVGNLSPNRFYRNSGNENHWFSIKVEGTVANKSGIGTRVRIVADGQAQMREVEGGSGHSSQNSLPLEFGLGRSTEIENMQIVFPTSACSELSLYNIPVDTLIAILEEDIPIPPPITDLIIIYAGNDTIVVQWTTPTTGWESAAAYDMRYNAETITALNWDTSAAIDNEPAPADPGTVQTHTITGMPSTVCIAMKVLNSAGGASPLSNVVCNTPSIEGTVYINGSQTPLEDIVLQLWSEYPGGSILATTTTGAGGQFIFSDLNEGAQLDIRAYGQSTGDLYYPAIISAAVPTADLEIYLDPTPGINPNPAIAEFYCLENTLYLGYPVQTGDIITVIDSDDFVAGKVAVTEIGGYLIEVYGNDSTTPEKDGPDEGESIHFFINEAYSGYANWHDQTIVELCLPIAENTVMIPLSKCGEEGSGWNLISWNVDTPNDSTHVIFSDIIDNVKVILGFDCAALSYHPLLPPEFSTLKEVDHLHGYWIKVFDDDTLYVSGLPVDHQTPIPLVCTWSLVSYLPNQPDSVYHALGSILDNLMLAYGYDCGVLSYHPDLPPEFSNLKMLEPTFGYWIRLVEPPDTLIYPETSLPIAISRSATQAGVFSVDDDLPAVTATNQWIELYGRQAMVDGQLLPVGTIITAVDKRDVICGVHRVTIAGQFGLLPVYADDPVTEEIEGVLPGQSFNLRLQHPGLDIDLVIDKSITWTEFGDVLPFEFEVETHEPMPAAFALEQNFPNPFNPVTAISFAIPRPAEVSLKIYNPAGQLVRILANDQAYQPGYYQLIWDGKNNRGSEISSGVYFYRLQAEGFDAIKQMVLLR
ncbi:MAG: T9SS type A sorting domain-containing protein, partial [Planctomycetes bacterium]|nr:T9SS type A sorting domain-containing protein [Planctomycetota bacterium]